jgi:Holliday junction resolvasome RuvABC endonuclease subunit
MKILGIDPGTTTGWALLENSTPLKMGEWKGKKAFEEGLASLLKEEQIDVVVVEDFVFRPGFKENKWKKTDVAKQIGYIEAACKMLGIEFAKPQSPAIKPVGYGMSGMKYEKGKRGMHMQDAIAHAMYWWRTIGIKRSNGSRENQTETRPESAS